MSIRKRNDSEGWRRGQGAYSKAEPIKQSGPAGYSGFQGHEKPKAGQGRYFDNDAAGLRTKQDFQYTAEKHDIFDNVEKNSGNGAPGPIRYGVD